MLPKKGVKRKIEIKYRNRDNHFVILFNKSVSILVKATVLSA